MNLGAGRPITTDAGSFMEEAGAGGRDLSTVDTVRSGRRHTFPSSDLAAEAGASGSALAADSAASAGYRAGQAAAFIRGMAGAETA